MEPNQDFDTEISLKPNTQKRKCEDLERPRTHCRTPQNPESCAENLNPPQSAEHSKEPIQSSLSCSQTCCSNCLIQVQTKLEGLSTRLENLEKKLAVDMEAMLALLKERSSASLKKV